MEWISVDSRVPDVREIYKDSPRQSDNVLVCTASENVLIGRYAETYKRRTLRWEMQGTGRTIEVTHWMPLPEPTK